MKTLNGETWRFSVNSPRADRAFLVQRCGEGVSRWIEMLRDELDQFSVVHQLLPGHHRFHYFVVENGAYLNCGTEGLFADRLCEPDPRVQIAPLKAMALIA